MIRTFLNLIPIKYGTYSTKNNKIIRTFSNGFSYIASECKSESEANRIANQLNLAAQ